MKISRNVILDLLPLYFANELSEDSRALVEKYLEDDPQLAKLAKQPEAMALSEKVPVPLTQNDEMMAYKRAKQVIMWRTIIIAVAIAIFLLLIMTMFFYSDPSPDTSGSTAYRGIHLRTSFRLVMEGLEDQHEISWNRCKAANSRAAEQKPDARNICLPIPKQEDRYIADKYPLSSALIKDIKI